MKLRPVLLVVLLLAGFYFVTTHMASTGALRPLLDDLHSANSATNVAMLRGSDGAFDLNVASAAPAFISLALRPAAAFAPAPSIPAVVLATCC